MTVDPTMSPRILFVSTYPPTRCGIASFTKSLIDSLEEVRRGRSHSGVIRLLPDWDRSACAERQVVAEVEVGSIQWHEEIDRWCQGFGLLWIQHEYGIFGRDEGLNVLELCRTSPLPIAVTLHTVPTAPTDGQRRILEGLGAAAELLVVMSQRACRRLFGTYDVSHRKVRVIPHGAKRFSPPHQPAAGDRRPTIVNWGLIGPGKGLEWGIRAMARLQDLDPPPRLVIRGTTHPNVRRREGELYRDQLVELIHTLGLEESVVIVDGYMSTGELEDLLQDADLVLLPYDSTEQVTSGVLVDAIGAGLPVVATRFPHAEEVLSGGAGRLVPQRDHEAMARAIEGLLTNPVELRMATEEARRVGQRFAWPTVAVRYSRLARLVSAGNRTSVA